MPMSDSGRKPEKNCYKRCAISKRGNTKPTHATVYSDSEGDVVSKRQLQRYNIYIETAMETQGHRTEGVTVNVSHAGVCVCCLSPVGAKTHVSLTFYFQDKRAGMLFESVAGVVRWEQKFGRLFMVGVEFYAPLNEENHFLILSHIELTKESWPNKA